MTDNAPELYFDHNGHCLRVDGVGSTKIVNGVKMYFAEDGHWRRSDNGAICILDGGNLLLEETTTKEEKAMANKIDEDGDIDIDQLWADTMAYLDEAVQSRAEQLFMEHATELKDIIQEEVRQELIDAVDSYSATMADSISELQEQVQILNENQQAINEAHDRVSELVYLATQDPKQFIELARQGAVENAADRGHYVDEVGDDEAARNRKSLSPGGGTNYGTQAIKEDVDPTVQRYLDHAELLAPKMAGVGAGQGITPAPEPTNNVIRLCEAAEREAANTYLAAMRGTK